jgi:hypothetical protein
MARQTMIPRAMIGIFSPTINQMNAQVTVGRMVPRNGRLQQGVRSAVA